MKLPPAMVSSVARFNQMTLRERAFISVALLVILILCWDTFFMSPLGRRQVALTQELSGLRQELRAMSDAIEAGVQNDPLSIAMTQQKSLQRSLQDTQQELAAGTSGLISPQRMLQAMRDVLERQHGLKLIALRNLDPVSLIPVAPNANASPAGPYMHPVELVVEGPYLDVLHYVNALEELPWRLYWRRLELDSTAYPVNRVRIELATLSMDREWLGM